MLILSRHDVEKVLTIPIALDAVEEAFRGRLCERAGCHVQALGRGLRVPRGGCRVHFARQRSHSCFRGLIGRLPLSSLSVSLDR